MKLTALLVVFGLLGAGCEKTSNVNAIQDEVTAVTSHYKHRFDELTRRITQLEQRGRTMVSVGEPTGLQDVRKLFVDTNKRLSELKVAANQAQTSIAAAAKSENARLELTKLRDELNERFEKGEIEVNAQIDQVEQWLAYVEYRPKVAAAGEPKKDEPPVPEPKKEEFPEDPNAKPADPAGAGSAEPKKDEPKKAGVEGGNTKTEPKKDDKEPKPDPKKPEPRPVPKPG